MGKSKDKEGRRSRFGPKDLGDQINIALYQDTLDDIRQLAEKHRYTVSAIVREAAHAGLTKVKDRLRKEAQRASADAKPKAKRRRKPVQPKQEEPRSKREAYEQEQKEGQE